MNDPNIGRIVVEELELQERIRELGKDVTSDYAANPPLLVGILKGAFMFMADLAPRSTFRSSSISWPSRRTGPRRAPAASYGS